MKILCSFLYLLLLAAVGFSTPSFADSSYIYQVNGVNSGIAIKVPVVAATTGAITLSGQQTIDNIAVVQNDRVLVKNQADQTANGIYNVSLGSWVRAPDFQGQNNVATGTLLYVIGGNTNVGFWKVTSLNPIVINNPGVSNPSNITFATAPLSATDLALASGFLYVGNAGNTAAAVALSGDCSLSNAGAITCTKTNGTSFTSAATAPVVNGSCMVATGGIWTAGSCTGPSGSGTVSSGTAGQLTYYATSSNTASGNANATISSGALTLGVSASVQGSLKLAGSSSGTTTLAAPTSSGGTLTLPAATDTIAVLGTKQSYTAAQRAAVASLTISTATFTPNFDTAQNFTLTLIHASCPCTLANPSTTPVAGQSGQITVNQSSSGSDTIGTYGTLYKFPGGTAPTLSTGTSAVDILSYYVIDATHIAVSASTNFQ